MQFLTGAELANLFKVTRRTVRRWVHDGLIEPRFRLRGGSCYELVFLEPEINRFFDTYFVKPLDLDLTHEPRGRKKRVERIRRIRNLHRIYVGRAVATKMARRLARVEGVDEAELEGDEDNTQEHDKGCSTFDHGSSARRWNMQPERTSDLDRGFNEDSDWDDEMDPKR